MDSIVGGFTIAILTIGTVAVIYQLGQSGNPVANDATSVANNTLGSLFK